MAVVAAIPAALSIGGAVKDLFSGIGSLFGGKLVYGLKAESFPKRWEDADVFRHQWFHQGDAQGKGSFWWDPAEQGGAGVRERIQNTTDNGLTMADYYVYLVMKSGRSQAQALQAVQDIYLDTASKAPAGYAGRGDFAIAERDGALRHFLAAYQNQFGAGAHPKLAGGTIAAGGVTPGLAAMTAGGVPWLLLGIVALAFLVVKK